MRNPVFFTVIMQGISQVKHLDSLSIWRGRVPVIWLLYLSRVMRIPVTYEIDYVSNDWEFAAHFAGLEHSMKMIKAHAPRVAEMIPVYWRTMAQYYAIEVPKFSDTGFEILKFEPSSTTDPDWGVVYDLEASPVKHYEREAMLSSVFRYLNVLYETCSLMSRVNTAVEYHEQDFEFTRLSHAYLMGVWEDFKALGLLKQKDTQESSFPTA